MQTQIVNCITSINAPISRKLFMKYIRNKYNDYRKGYSFKEQRFLLQEQLTP